MRTGTTLGEAFGQRLVEHGITRHLSATGLRLDREAPELLVGPAAEVICQEGEKAVPAGAAVRRT